MANKDKDTVEQDKTAKPNKRVTVKEFTGKVKTKSGEQMFVSKAFYEANKDILIAL